MPINGLISNSYSDYTQNKAESLSKVDTANAEDKKLLEVCQEFESIFVNMMLKAMRESVNDEDSLIPKSAGTEMFESMRDEELAKQMTMGKTNSGFGLADTLYSQMKASKAYR